MNSFSSPLTTFLFFCLFLSNASMLTGNVEEEFPVLYRGRFRPVESYARLWLYDHYHAETVKEADRLAFNSPLSSRDLLWNLALLGSEPYLKAPLFWIRSAALKDLLHLSSNRNHFSYQELQEVLQKTKEDREKINIKVQEYATKNKTIAEEFTLLISFLKEFEEMQSFPTRLERAFEDRFEQLKQNGFPPKEIEKILEDEYPLLDRIQKAGSLFKALPSKYQEGGWLPLQAMYVKKYHPHSNSLKLIHNFTLFSDEAYVAVRKAYFNLAEAYKKPTEQSQLQKLHTSLAQALITAYQPLAGKSFQKAHGKSLMYPTLNQLFVESLYVSFRWVALLLFLYMLGSFLLFFSRQDHWVLQTAILMVAMAFICHTVLLGMRIYILGRPPVSNMFETIIYVPWVAVGTSLIFPTFRRQPFVIQAACLSSLLLLFLLEMTHLNQNLDAVSAVLDSQFWLMIHVLMVVGSYGILILSGLLGHFFLFHMIRGHYEPQKMNKLSEMILYTMYWGVTLLIVGTILGGVWAAESWGRFWDWDPKEAWAFISSCFYLIWIHAYRFNRISSFGLAFGAVAGLLVISFTWYGVNYILGTGLHSYGFGTGGEYFYYAFLGAETLFLIFAMVTNSFWSTKRLNKTY